MNPVKLLLAASLTANAALVIAFVAGVSGDSSAPTSTAATPATSAARPAGSAAIDPEMWSKLSINDWSGLAASLRGKGFPPSVVRAIVSAQVSESFRDRRKSLDTSINDTPFWKNPLPDPQTLAAQRALSREQQNVLKGIFGNNPNADDPMAAVYGERDLSGVPTEKRDQIRQIIQEFSEQREAVFERASGAGTSSIILPEDQAKLQQLENLQHAEIAKVLTPDELEAYDFRHSSTASSLKSRLAAFDATEGEFKALYKLQAAYDAQWGPLYATPTQEESRARSAAQTELNKQFEAALGPERYADYQRSTDYDYRQTTTLVARLELPPETANTLYAVQKEFEQRRNDSMRSSLPMDQRIAELTALQQEAIARITPLLGNRPTAVQAYQQYGGRWLQNLVPRTAPTPAPRPAVGGGG